VVERNGRLKSREMESGRRGECPRLDEDVNGDEVEGDLGLRDRDEHVEEKEGSVYDEVEDRGRRECLRFGNGNVEEPVSILLNEEEGMRTAMRSKGSPLLLPAGDMLIPPSDCDERECKVGVASAFALALHFHIQKSGRTTCWTLRRKYRP
jgi:hypothetical protein